MKPEQLPPAEDVKKVERRIKSVEKKAVEKPDKIKRCRRRMMAIEMMKDDEEPGLYDS